MAITDPQAIRFVNEEIRPLCEEARALIVKINAMQTEWFAGLNLVIVNDNQALEDGREAQGVSRLTGADINSAVNILTSMVQASNAEIISKPCVRPLSAS